MEMKPGAIAILAGGVVLLISSFLDWRGPFNPWDDFFFGLTGLFVFVLGALVAVVAAIRAFAPQVNLPGNIAGLTMNEAIFGIGFAVSIYTLGMLFADEGAKGGTILALLSGIAIMAGAYMERDAGTTDEARRTI